MNAVNPIFLRRSIRRYTGETLTEEELDFILRAAYASPAGMGRYDSLQITVVRNKAYLDALEDAFSAHTGKKNAHPLYGAPLLIILSSVFPGIPTDNSSYSNTAIISQNIALAAASIGVGACHIWGAIRALNTREDLLAKLSLPEGFMPCCAVALGHTQEIYTQRDVPCGKIATTFLD